MSLFYYLLNYKIIDIIYLFLYALYWSDHPDESTEKKEGARAASEVTWRAEGHALSLLHAHSARDARAGGTAETGASVRRDDLT